MKFKMILLVIVCILSVSALVYYYPNCQYTWESDGDKDHIYHDSKTGFWIHYYTDRDGKWQVNTNMDSTKGEYWGMEKEDLVIDTVIDTINLDEELIKRILDGDTIPSWLPSNWMEMTKELRSDRWITYKPVSLPTIDHLGYLIVNDSIKFYVREGGKGNRCFMALKLGEFLSQ